MKKLLLVLLTVVVVATFIFGGCAKPTPAPAPTPTPAPAPAPKQPTVLKFVAFLSDVPPDNIQPRMFIDMVKNNSNGELIIDWVGGPEAIPPPDQWAAVQSGAIDMAQALYAFGDPIAPGIGCLEFMEISFQEYRQNGAYEYLNQITQKAGVYLVCEAVISPPNMMATFYTGKDKKVEHIGDLKGLKFAVPQRAYAPFVEAFGGIPVQMNMPDFFTAMERGTVDGFHQGMPGVEGFGLLDVTGYMIDHPQGSSGGGMLVNLKVWNSLPKNLQDALIKSGIEFEQAGIEVWMHIYNDLKQKLEQRGAVIVHFPPDEVETWYQLYRDSTWGLLIERNPEVAPKLREMLVP